MASLHGRTEPRRCILIVDDDRTILRILARILQHNGYDTEMAESGHEALEKIASRSYAAAIIDVRLGDMDGLDLLRSINEVSPKTLKIMLTGYPSDEDRVKALRQCADLYLAKPIKGEMLVEIIDGRLRKSPGVARQGNGHPSVSAFRASDGPSRRSNV